MKHLLIALTLSLTFSTAHAEDFCANTAKMVDKILYDVVVSSGADLAFAKESMLALQKVRTPDASDEFTEYLMTLTEVVFRAVQDHNVSKAVAVSAAYQGCAAALEEAK